MSLRVAIDIGGTFTDLFVFDERSQPIPHAKSLTTPRDPVEGPVVASGRGNWSQPQSAA